MSKPKYTPAVGDRVRLHGFSVAGVNLDNWTGRVHRKLTDCVLVVLDNSGALTTVIDSQCRLRRFRKKPEAKKAREWWVATSDGRTSGVFNHKHEAQAFESRSSRIKAVHVREIIPGEKSYLDGLRDALKALKNAGYLGHAVVLLQALIDKELANDEA